MHKLIYISFICLLVSYSATAQEKKYIYIDSSLVENNENEVLPGEGKVVVTVTPDEDHTVSTISKFDEYETDTTLYLNGLELSSDSVKYWREAKEFAYTKYLDSLLRDRQEKEKAMIKKAATTGPGLVERFLSSYYLKVLLWTLAVLFVLFILYRLFLTEGVFRRETKASDEVSQDEEEEMISPDTDFDALIGQALQQNNFRQAVRYQYLRTLHKLAAKDMIELARDKTNYQYVTEIRNSSLQNEFSKLTLNYEYAWYGEFEIETGIYRRIETGFNDFNQKL